jgi:hypothetical protein
MEITSTFCFRLKICRIILKCPRICAELRALHHTPKTVKHSCNPCVAMFPSYVPPLVFAGVLRPNDRQPFQTFKVAVDLD